MLPLIPMVDDLIIYGDEGYDDWGLPVKADPVEIKGNFHYNTTRETVVGNNGDEVVYTANIYLPVGTEITYEHTISFEDDRGNKVEKKPLRIQDKRDAWGTPLLVRVVV